MLSRLGLVFTMVLAILFACAGVVWAQSQDADDEQATEGEEFVEDTSRLDAGDPIPGKYIVVLNDDVTNPGSVANDLSGDLDLETTNVYDDAIEGFAAEVPPGELPELRSDPRVEAVVQDRVIEASRQKRPTGIRRIDVPQSSTKAGNGKGKVSEDIAILDTGIYKKHKDLNIAGGTNCVGKKRKAWNDGDGHGTHVAGTAAAKDNRIGVVGVAPGARLWAVKVLGNDGEGSFSTVMCGIDWVTNRNLDGDSTNNIEVANMSLGATVPGDDDGNCGWTLHSASAELHRAVCKSVNEANVFYAVAAGNDSKDFINDVPTAFGEVLTVTAMTDYNGKPSRDFSTCSSNAGETPASFSNYTTTGSSDEEHTIAAPGVCINSTWNNGKYKTISGTSMASPHVAGTAALCIAKGGCPRNDPVGTMDKLRSDAAAQPPEYGFEGDAHPPEEILYYGFLEYAGGY